MRFGFGYMIMMMCDDDMINMFVIALHVAVLCLSALKVLCCYIAWSKQGCFISILYISLSLSLCLVYLSIHCICKQLYNLSSGSGY